MSFSLLDKEEENENQILRRIIPTPNGENEEKDNDCYTCTDCNKNIEILDLDETNNILSFQCPVHGEKSITLKEFLKIMPKNTFLFSTCSSCQKKQNEINNNNIFKYCCNCKKIFCDNCINNHEKDHTIIENDKLTIKCEIHPKNKNKYFCFDCKIHLCEECLEQRKHMMHKKINLIEIKPSNEEINTFLNFVNDYKKTVLNLEVEKYNKQIDLQEKYKSTNCCD